MPFLGETTILRVYVLGEKSAPPLNTIANNLHSCCADSSMKVFADLTSNDDYRNDKSAFIDYFDETNDTAIMELLKWDSNGWQVVAQIDNNNYGIFKPFGFFENSLKQKFISFEADWKKILQAFGQGSYSIRTKYNSLLYGEQSKVSFEYCLKKFSEMLTDGTVKLEFWNTGILGDTNDDTKIRDFGKLYVYNSLRVNGYFGYPKFTYQMEDIEYNNGKRMYVEDEQTPSYKLYLRLLHFNIHNILRTDFMQADEIAITDYNSKNNFRYIKKQVMKDSTYEPQWYELKSNYASVELQFKQRYNRNRKLRY